MCLSKGIKELPRHQRFIEVAKKVGLKSTLEHKHGACIVYRNKIVSTGYNYMLGQCNESYENHPKLLSIHAEVAAIKEFLRLGPRNGYNKQTLKDCKLYVVRIGKESMNHPIKLSKPCKNCENTIKRFNIPKVYFSMDDY